MSVTLSQFRTQIRNRADMNNSGFITDPTLNTWINVSAYELYDLLIGAYGSNYAVANPYVITTDGTNYLYALPADFYKLLGVDLNTGVNINPWQTIKQFNFNERNQFQIPQAGRQTQLWYAPRMTEMVSDSDSFDGISGWTEYVVIDCAIKCKDTEESDVTVLAAKLAELKARIDQMSLNRNIGEPARVSDVYRENNIWLGPSLRYRLSGNNIWLGEFQLDGGVPFAF